jgi:hypothetical protein
MKKIILLLVCLTSLTVSAQRRNSNGEKMVSKLEINNYNIDDELYEKSVISYIYNNDKLVKLDNFITTSLGDIRTSKNTDSYHVTFTYNNGKISKPVPKYGADCVYGYEYVLNSNSKVKTVREKFVKDNSYSYIQYDYRYDDYGKLSLMYYQWYNKHGRIYESEDDIERTSIKWLNGNMYVDGFQLTYSEDINDLNINPSVFLLLGSHCMLFGDKAFEHSAEWFGMKSHNLLNETLYIDGVLKYHYRIENNIDERGNLNEIVVIRIENSKWRLRKVIKISYLK